MDGVRKINEDVMKNGRALIITTNTVNKNNLPNGTLFISNDGDLKYLTRDNNEIPKWENFKFENIFNDQTFDDSYFLDNSFHGCKIIDDTITNKKYQDKSISSDKIMDNTIETINIKEIDASKITNKSIITSKIHEKAITNELIDDNAINSNNIKSNSITHDHLQDEIIYNNNIKNNSIIASEKIKELSITNSLLQDNIILSNNIKENEILNKHIKDNEITFDKIKAGEIKGNLIPNFAIKDNHIEAVDGSKINDNSISGKKIRRLTITNELIANNSINMQKLDDDLQRTINNSISVKNNIIINETEYLNTAWIKGNVTIASEDDSKLTLNIKGDINASGDITGGRVFNPYFADIAEGYIPTEKLYPGDAVALSLKGNLTVEKLNKDNQKRFLGFVSNEYATVFGATKKEISSNKKVPITLVGRINVSLPKALEAKIGDYLILMNGQFYVCDKFLQQTDTLKTVGKFLENKTIDMNKALCQIIPC